MPGPRSRRGSGCRDRGAVHGARQCGAIPGLRRQVDHSAGRHIQPGGRGLRVPRSRRRLLWRRVLEVSQTYAGAERLMYVVGATRPEWLAEVRAVVPDRFLLVPGVGAQGGTWRRCVPPGGPKRSPGTARQCGPEPDVCVGRHGLRGSGPRRGRAVATAMAIELAASLTSRRAVSLQVLQSRRAVLGGGARGDCVGQCGIHAAGGYTFIEAFYMTMITVSTVGFRGA